MPFTNKRKAEEERVESGSQCDIGSSRCGHIPIGMLVKWKVH